MTVVCACGKTLQIPDALAGQGVICPFCRAAVAAPASIPSPDDPTVSLIQALQRQPDQAPAHDEHVATLAADIQRSATRNQPPPAPFVPPAPAVPPAPVRSKRDPVHYYIAAGAVALLLVVGLIVLAWSDREPPPTASPAAAPPPETNVAAQPADDTGPKKVPSSDFHPLFGDIPTGDSKDYEKRAAQKLPR
jgi:hypothetical protein